MDEFVGTTKSGHSIWREPNEAGGHRYISDSCGCGHVVWDTSLTSIEELLFCIEEEESWQEPECSFLFDMQEGD